MDLVSIEFSIEWRMQYKIKVSEWSTQSPDINLMLEHDLKQAAHAQNPPVLLK